MGTTNIANWGQSYIDADGKYVGDVIGDVTGGVTGSVRGYWYATNSQTYTSDGPINLMNQVSVLDASSSSTQLTLAHGASGRVLMISCKDATNTADVDLDLFGSASTITFTAANQAVILVYNIFENWVLVSNSGATIS